MLEPSRNTSPLCQCLATRSFMRLRERRNVVFPDPVGPIKAVMAPLGIATLMPERTVAEPKPRARSFASIAVAAGGLSTSMTPVSAAGTIEDVMNELIRLLRRSGDWTRFSQRGQL